MDDRFPYRLATMIYHQGMECDAAARNIRLTLESYVEMIKNLTKSDMGKDYNSTKER